MGIKMKMFWLRKLRITVLLTIRSAIAHKHREIHSNAFWVFSEMAAHFQTLPIIPDGNDAKIPHPGDMMSDEKPYPGDIHQSNSCGLSPPPLLGLDIDRCIIIFTHAFAFVS